MLLKYQEMKTIVSQWGKRGILSELCRRQKYFVPIERLYWSGTCSGHGYRMKYHSVAVKTDYS